MFLSIYLRRVSISSRKALSALLSIERGVSSFRLARVGALSNKRRSWTDLGKSGLKRPTKAWSKKGRLRINVVPAKDGYNFSY
jgi:hypothetical protein